MLVAVWIGVGTSALFLTAMLGSRYSRLIPNRPRLLQGFSFSPNTLSKLDIVLLISVFVLRAIKIRLGLQTRLSRLVEIGDGRPATSGLRSLPDYVLNFPLRLRPEDRAGYSSALLSHSDRASCGLAEDQLREHELQSMSNPAHLCLYLSAITEPAFLILLAQRDCPVQPLGAVNVRNVFELLDEPLAREVANCVTSSANASLTVTSSFLQGCRMVKRGLELDVVVSIVVSKPQLDKEIEAFRQTFTILEFARWPSPRGEHRTSIFKEVDSRIDLEPHLTTQMKHRLHMTRDDPMLWAALCLDYNPIHHIDIAARVMGFAGKIAHGNHVAARAIVTLKHEAVDFALSKNPSEKRVFTMQVAFRRPVVVQADLKLMQIQMQSGASQPWQYLVADQTGKTCVELSLSRMAV